MNLPSLECEWRVIVQLLTSLDLIRIIVSRHPESILRLIRDLHQVTSASTVNGLSELKGILRQNTMTHLNAQRLLLISTIFAE